MKCFECDEDAQDSAGLCGEHLNPKHPCKWCGLPRDAHWIGRGGICVAAGHCTGFEASELPGSSVDPNHIWIVCAECGGKNIEMLEWIDANTNEYIGNNENSGENARWCRDCDEHTDFCEESEFEPNKTT